MNQREQKNIIDDNYNVYLKGISSSDSNITKKDIKNISKINMNNNDKNLKSLINKISLYDKTDIYNNIKKINNNNNSNIPFKKDKIFKLRKKFIFIEEKFWSI